MAKANEVLGVLIDVVQVKGVHREDGEANRGENDGTCGEKRCFYLCIHTAFIQRSIHN